MKMKKKLLLPFLAFSIAMNISCYSFADATTDNKTEESKIVATSKKIWSQFTSALINSKLSDTFNTPTTAISNGLNLNGSYSFESAPTFAGKYLGIDTWNINISASPEVFGLVNKSSIGVGASASRQFTFIQQFDSRMLSLMRLPYDPITKIPIKSEVFFKTKLNTTTQQNEPLIKDGDFIAFRAPLTLSIGTGQTLAALLHESLSTSLYWVISGEFDIHIFKMNNNQVRVKVIAVKDNTQGVSTGLNLLGFSQVGRLLISRLIDTNLLQMNYSVSDSDLFIADYIFNLNKPEARDMYDELIGHKLKLINQIELVNQLKIENPFAKDSSTNERLIGDLDRLSIASQEDQEKPSVDRRITRVSTAKNNTQSDSWGTKINLFRLILRNSQETKATSRATIYDQNNYEINNKYIFETQSKIYSSQWFRFWGESHSTTQSLLLKADDNFVPLHLLGFQFTQIKQDMSMSRREFLDLKNRYTSILPSVINNMIQWPAWDFTTKDSVQNAYVQQELLFTENLFKINIQIDAEKIKSELIQIIKNYGNFKSQPMNLTAGIGDDEDPRQTAFQRHDYLGAYDEKWEQKVIPLRLAEVFDATKTTEERYQSYEYLMHYVPLFSEINNLLILRLIPENLISQVCIAKLSMSAKNQPALESYYPSKEIYNKSNIFREISYQTQYILNRSFDLRNFMREDGSIYSTEEILAQRTAK